MKSLANLIKHNESFESEVSRDTTLVLHLAVIRPFYAQKMQVLPNSLKIEFDKPAIIVHTLIVPTLG